MPSGKTHDKITYFSAPIVLAATWGVTQNMKLAILTTASFFFAGFMFSGDLDTRSVQYKRWGPLKWLWVPYQKMVPHRSPFSHGLFLGMMARLTYLTFILGAGFFALTRLAVWLEFNQFASQFLQALHQIIEFIVNHPIYFGGGLIGLWLGGASHTLADEIVSRIKKARKKKLKKPTLKRKKS